MKVLIVKTGVQGIAHLNNIEYYIYDNVKSVADIMQKLTLENKNYVHYKYCVLKEDISRLPYIKIENSMLSQMQEFVFEKVRYKDLNVSEDIRKDLILGTIKRNTTRAIGVLRAEGLDLLLDQVFGEKVEDKLLAIGEKIEDLKEKSKDTDHKKYLKAL